ncbi:MAG: PspC domain-containing protein [Bacteroidia bacterium]
MKKTTTIHLSGILFNIEEDAYQLISEYLTSIEKHFESHHSKKEILEDIENRIAEILSAKLNGSKQVITPDDIQEVINTMGKVEDFDSEQSTSNDTQTFKMKKRFYRNPDDKVLGGVCSGIATYFDIDPLWIRLAWAIMFFVFGSGFLFYLLLWIIIPEAKTPIQKLEMRGEPVNISNISKGIAQDFSNFGKRAGKEFSNIQSNKLIAFFQNLLQHLLNFIYGTGKTILKIFAAFIMIVLVFILIVLIGSMFGNSYVVIDTNRFVSTFSIFDFFTDAVYGVMFSLSLLLLIGVPILLIISALIKFIFNIKKRIRYVGLTALILWLLGWGLFVYSFMDVAGKYSEKSVQTTTLSNYALPHQTIYIKMSEDDTDYKDKEHFRISIGHKLFYSEDGKKANIGFPSVRIKKSKDDSLRIKIVRSALAENKKEARHFTENIQYSINIKDSVIELSPSYDIPKTDKFHFQKVNVWIEIPQNRYVYFSKNLKYYLNDAPNNIDADEEDMVGKKWLMGIDHLQCLEFCDDISNVHHKHNHRHKKKSDDENEDEYEEDAE